MLQQQKLVRLPLVGAIVLGLLAGVYLLAWKRYAKPPIKIVKHPVETPADEALKYWTADKMRDAGPAPMPHVVARGRKKRDPRRPPRPSRPRQA